MDEQKKRRITWIGLEILGFLGLFLTSLVIVLLWLSHARGPIETSQPILLWTAFFAIALVSMWVLLIPWFAWIFPQGSFIGKMRVPLHALTAMVLAGIWFEMLSLQINQHSLRQNYSGAYTKGFWLRDPILGIKPPINVKVDAQKTAKNGEVIYKVDYTIDSFGNRLTPQSDMDKRSQSALFFGCSFIFGDGLNDDQTLPACFARECPDIKAINCGFSGYGPQQMLEILKQRDWKKELGSQEAAPLLIYGFIDQHVDRVIGSMMVVANWGMGFPYYYLDASGNLVRDNNFGLGRPELSDFYAQLAQIPSVKLFALDFPLWKTAADFELTAKIIIESRKIFLRTFPKGNFVVFFYPGSTTGRCLQPFLDKESIRVLDLAALAYLRAGEFLIHPEDGHPSAKANQELAKILKERLREKELTTNEHQ